MTEANEPGSGEQSPSLQVISIIPAPTEEQLAERELTDHTEHRRSFIKWVLHFGKDIESTDGYAKSTARVRVSRADQYIEAYGQEDVLRLREGSSSGYPSSSEADLVFAAHLYFWCKGDRQLMDECFRASGRMRPKWDGQRGDQTQGK